MQDTITRLRAKKQDEGFTLIELLVVVVIIGVLVAIAVPVYLNYRQGAADKAAQSDLRGAVSAIEQFYTNNGNQYPTAIAADTAGTAGKIALAGGGAASVNVSDGTLMGLANNSSTYIICARNTNGTGVGSITKMYVYNSNGGSVKTSTSTSMATCLTSGV